MITNGGESAFLKLTQNLFKNYYYYEYDVIVFMYFNAPLVLLQGIITKNDTASQLDTWRCHFIKSVIAFDNFNNCIHNISSTAQISTTIIKSMDF